MSIQPSSGELDAFRIWAAYFKKIMEELDKQGKINSKHGEDMKKYYRMYNFANQSALHINEFDGIARIPEERKKFLNTNPDIEEDLVDEIWYDMLIIATLRCYWLIEISLITLLKDIQYGRNGIVEGKENLGQLKKILDGLGFDKNIDWSAIDISFRNALAHGWFYRKKQNFVYYTKSKLTNGKLLDRKKMIYKCRLVQLYSLVFAGLVGEWKDVKDFGSKDPLKKLENSKKRQRV